MIAIEAFGTQSLTWIGILVCLSQSALFSGLNLAFFTISRLRLDIEVDLGNKNAIRVATIRKDSNFLLGVLLWGNVGINVLLALLAESVLASAAAFIFSTFVITIFGEIIPQAYFSRNALRVASLTAPILRVYQILLYPLAKPTALILDRWLGLEGIRYFREIEMESLIRQHIDLKDADIGRLEGLGALNFLAMDDLSMGQEGEPVDPSSIIALPEKDGIPIFPEIRPSAADPFLQAIEASKKRWIIATNARGEPYLVIDSDAFLRAALFDPGTFKALAHCHKPIIVYETHRRFGEAIAQLHLHGRAASDRRVIENDIILLWTSDTRRVITGADILGRLLAGTSPPPALSN